MGTVRSTAVARENDSIDASQSRAIAAREEQSKPRNALEAMAANLQISPQGLKNTLVNTVFAKCENEEQFMALVVVANTYGLNPLLKEIYAFPAKGQGIVPMVSIDGWIRIMNEHPQFDGIDFDYHNDENGKTEAIESIIYRKDRTHPIKVIEYLEECERPTDPWKKSPRRMLRHRALMQGARIAFGFSGIAAEGDEDEFINGGSIQGETVRVLPTRQSLAEELDDEIPALSQEEVVDEKTGEVIETDSRGMTQVDEETARALDAAQDEGGDAEGDEPFEDVAADVVEEPLPYPEADFRGDNPPESAVRNQTWFRPIDGKLRYAHETEKHGIKWYLKPQVDAQTEPAAAPATAAASDEEPAWMPWVNGIKSDIADAGDNAELKVVEGDFLKQSGALPEKVQREVDALISARRKALSAG